MKTYGSTEIQKKLRISRMQAIQWTEKGAVVPLKDASGRGSRRVYSWQNLVEMAICKMFNQYGIETHHMVRILKGLRDYRAKDGATFWGRLEEDLDAGRWFLVVVRAFPAEGESFPLAMFPLTIEEDGPGFVETFLWSAEELGDLLTGQACAIVLDMKTLVSKAGS